MSGYSEIKPCCPKCKISYTDGMDNRILIVYNTYGNRIAVISSEFEVALTKVRISYYYSDFLNNGKNIIGHLYCRNCGDRIYDKDFIESVENYISTYKEISGMFFEEYSKVYEKATNEGFYNSDYVAPYNEFVDDAVVCNKCGNREEYCNCEIACSCGCSPCKCCYYCGSYDDCDCYCPECNTLRDNCCCDDEE